MDIQLHYAEKGSGEPLILLHGNGESSEYFARQTEYFSQRYRVIAPDTRGQGRSPRGSGEFSISRFADDLRDFMDELGIGSADILGFSDGGNIALTFALRYPSRVRKLILNGANLFPAGVRRSVQLPIELGYRIASLSAGHSEKARRNAELLGLMVKEPNIRPEQLKALGMPVLVIAGTRDMIKRSHTQLIYDSLPNARLVLLEGDHFIANRRPEEFNREVERFLNE